jgi:hypothetical protein
LCGLSNTKAKTPNYTRTKIQTHTLHEETSAEKYPSFEVERRWRKRRKAVMINNQEESTGKSELRKVHPHTHHRQINRKKNSRTKQKKRREAGQKERRGGAERTNKTRALKNCHSNNTSSEKEKRTTER